MSENVSHSYVALRVQQMPNSEPFYLLSAPAAEILEWCDVPRAKADFMADYQRALSDRHREISEYFKADARNVTPGAVIIAVDSDYIEIDGEDGDVCRLSIHEDSRSFEAKLSEVFGTLTVRLTDEELEGAGIAFSPVDVNDDFISDGDDDPVEDSAASPVSYLTELAAELQQAIQDFSSLTEDRQAAICEYVEGNTKPGLIIDGQHRVFGAKGVSKFDIGLPIVLMPGLPHSEQVFHFYVLNSKAKPLKKTELRRIISTSLTDGEIEDLYDRFSQAGVEAHEARWSYQAHTREDSPFRGLVDFGFSKMGEVIPENVMDQVIRGFTKMGVRKYAELLRPVADKWEDPDYRLDTFFRFWSAIATADDMEGTWEQAREVALESGKQNQIFLKVSLLTLQAFVLDKMGEVVMFKETNPLGNADDLGDLVGTIVENIPGEFFEREWKMKQMDTSEGRQQLYQYMDLCYKAKGKPQGNWKLFQG